MPSALHKIIKKVSVVANLARTQGMGLTLKSIFQRILEDTWLLGKIVEFKGPQIRFKGLSINLDDAGIGTRLKSRFLIGSWEVETRELVERHLPFDRPLIELGACIGVMSCFANSRLTDPNHHVVVEANPKLLDILARNREANNCRFRIVNAALAYDADMVAFYLSDKINEGATRRKGGGQELTVPATTLRSIMEREGFERANIICDIEGAEHQLVLREVSTLRDSIEWFVVEVHGDPDTIATTHESLESLGFDLVDTILRNRTYRNRRFAGSPSAGLDGLAVT